MTAKIEQGVKQELTTEVPQSSSNLTMNKIGKDMEAEVKLFLMQTTYLLNLLSRCGLLEPGWRVWRGDRTRL